ncbi:MAG: hypothetical protein ACYS80_13140 [Planctomycetota bacterium]
MKWLEIIELRVTKSKQAMLKSQLQGLINEISTKSQKQVIRVYNLAMVETDISIHLLHDLKRMDNGGSPLGLRLTSALKEFGLVNHSVWIEMHDKS